MKYFIDALLILGIGLLIYGYIYPTKYCLDINIKDTYYAFTYKPVATFVLLFSLVLYIASRLYELVR
ncbi:hypothetical protein EAH81_02470 [Flavobacterium pectinovorum]|uniref:Uncharacterized protein n=1 Tax=Flavobacterium pectinovorum TaxID=29533 RepID=A0A502F2G8_9FLAO|nr:hypothetical protein EAH81_02470 [Flavobacterium pectinovorum]